MESHGKKNCHGKVMENEGNKKSWKLKNPEKSHGKVMEFVVFATSEFWL